MAWATSGTQPSSRGLAHMISFASLSYVQFLPHGFFYLSGAVSLTLWTSYLIECPQISLALEQFLPIECSGKFQTTSNSTDRNLAHFMAATENGERGERAGRERTVRRPLATLTYCLSSRRQRRRRPCGTLDKTGYGKVLHKGLVHK